MKTKKITFLVPLGIVALLATPLAAGEEKRPTLEEFLKKIAGENADVRYTARFTAPEYGAAAVVPLGDLMVHENLEVARTARAALELIVHHAGRPGAMAEREPVAAELAKLLQKDRPVAVHREVLHLIAFIGGHAIVPAVADCLMESLDPKEQEAARLALERIPGEASVEALIRAMKALPSERAADIAAVQYSLSKKGGPKAVEALLGWNGGDFNLVNRLASLEGLARLGAPEAILFFQEEFARAEASDRPRLYSEYLRLADNLKDPKAAGAIYREVMAKASTDYLRERALGALCRPGEMEGLTLLIAGLSDSSYRVRRMAALRIESLKGPEILAALREAYRSAKTTERPGLLRVIAERDSEGAKPFIQYASASENVELKITALDLLDSLDNPAMENDYRQAAESGPEWIKAAAIKGYLILAKKKIESGDRSGALPMFTRVLEIAREGSQRLEALRGLVAAGDPKEINRLEPLLQDPILGTEAARGYVSLAAALGKSGDKAAAERHLMKIVTGDFPRDLKGQATGELRDLGLDPQGETRARGFVLDWWMVTPIRNPDGKGFDTKYFPEETIQLGEVNRIGARRYVWQKFQDMALDGRIDLLPLFRRTERVLTYAYTELDSPREQDVLFKMGSDDGIACWLNGERIHANNAARGLQVDQDVVKARLAAGKNKILLKITNNSGPWEFCFRITDPGGKPLQLKATVD